jgi:hypothetical protein
MKGESIFELLLGLGRSQRRTEYYYCKQELNEVVYKCKIVYGDNIIIPMYPDVEPSLHKKTLEGMLRAPVTIEDK